MADVAEVDQVVQVVCLHVKVCIGKQHLVAVGIGLAQKLCNLQAWG